MGGMVAGWQQHAAHSKLGFQQVLHNRMDAGRVIRVRAVQPAEGNRRKSLPRECGDWKDGVLEDLRGPHCIRRHGSERSTIFQRRQGLRLYLCATAVRGVCGEGAEVENASAVTSVTAGG